MQARSVNIKDGEYPEILKTMKNPPEELFVNGKIIPSDRNAVAIVGTRRATFYGLQQCEKIAYDLAERGITIVSGMARGIDSRAHRGALKAGGRTIAVMGSGHDCIYPPENKKLYDEISQNGAVISQFPNKTEPRPFNFPMRNRIISGLALGILVIEAPEKSGALITAECALEQGREVFAIPGNINSTKSSGSNALIKDGAKLVQDAEDILEEFERILDFRNAEKKRSLPVLSSEEKAVFDIVGDEAKAIDEISDISGMRSGEISKILFKLELKKLIKTMPGSNFVRT